MRSPRILTVLACLSLAASVAAQPPASIIPANPQSPSINMPLPTGAVVGTSTEVTLTGANLTDPIAIVVDAPIKASIPSDSNNGKDPAKLRIKLDVPGSTPIGMYPIRVVTRLGVSNFRPFCVDSIPAAPTSGANRSKSTALPIPVPSVASGRIDTETSEFFKVSVKPGQRLCFDVLARRIGSSLDPVLMFYDAKTGRELPSLYADDSPGCQTDARLTHTFKEGGEFLVEVRDSIYRGGGDYWYRLRASDAPSAITPYPLAAKVGTTARVEFAGTDLDGVTPVTVAIPSGALAVPVSAKGSRPTAGWPVSVMASNFDEIVETEPNNDPAKANRVPVPGGVSARFQDKSDLDCFVFKAVKGQRLLINSQTHELLSPADVYFILKDAKGNEVAKSNPQAGTGIDFNPPADGDYTLVVEHLNYSFGPNEVYRITIAPPQPGFDIALPVDRVEVPRQGMSAVAIPNIARRDYGGPIELSVEGPKGITGSIVVTAGGPPAPNLPIALLPISAGDLAPGFYPIRIRAKATINGKEYVTYANTTALTAAGMGNLPFPPQFYAQTVIVSVVEPPFRLTGKLATAEAARGTATNLILTATRGKDFPDDIAIQVVGLPPNVASPAKPIAKGTTEIQFPLTAAANAPLGSFNIGLIGKGKFQGREIAVAIPVVVTIATPFDIKAEAVPPLKPGEKKKFKVTTVRRGGFAAPIDVEVKNLPAKVTAPKVQIPAGKNDVEIEVSAAADVAAGDKADVNVTGVGGGHTAPTPNFKISVLKK